MRTLKQPTIMVLATLLVASSLVFFGPVPQASAQANPFTCDDWRHFHSKPPLDVLPEWLGGWDPRPSDAVVEAWIDANPGAFPSWLKGSTPEEGDGFMADCPVIMGGYVAGPSSSVFEAGVGKIGSRAGYESLVKLGGLWKIAPSVASLFNSASRDETSYVGATVTPPELTPRTISFTPWDSADWEIIPDPSGVGGKLVVDLGEYIRPTASGWRARIHPSTVPCKALRCNYGSLYFNDGEPIEWSGENLPPSSESIEIELQACGAEPGVSGASAVTSALDRNHSLDWGSPPFPACAGAVAFNGLSTSSVSSTGSNSVPGYYGPFTDGDIWVQTRVQTFCGTPNSAMTGFASSSSWWKRFTDFGVWTKLGGEIEIPSRSCDPGMIHTRTIVDLVRYGLDNGLATRWIDVINEVDWSSPFVGCLIVGNDCDVSLTVDDEGTGTTVRVDDDPVDDPEEAAEIVRRVPRALPDVSQEAVDQDDPALDPFNPGYEEPTPTTSPPTTQPPTTTPGDTAVPPPVPPKAPIGPPPEGDGWSSCIDDQGSAFDDVTWNPVTWVRGIVRWVWVPIYCALHWFFVPSNGWLAPLQALRDEFSESDTGTAILGVASAFSDVSGSCPTFAVQDFVPFDINSSERMDVLLCDEPRIQTIYTFLAALAAMGVLWLMVNALSTLRNPSRTDDAS